MIEDAMFLALGFFVAMLLALACIPILWARALRLSRRRLELRVPLSAAEIDAERDGIRAEAAISHRRLEQALEASKRAGVGLSADLGHRTVSLVNAERAAAALDAKRVALSAEIHALTHTCLDEQAQRVATEKALHDADAHTASLTLDVQEQRGHNEALTAMAEERRHAIAALEMQSAELLSRIAGREAAVADLTSSLGSMRSALAEMTRERDTARNEALLATTRRQIIEAQLKIETERGKEQYRLEAAQAEAQGAGTRRIMDQTEAGTFDLAPIADLKHRFDTLQARLTDRPVSDSGSDFARESENRALRFAIVEMGDAALRLLDPRKSDEMPVQPVEDHALESGARP